MLGKDLIELINKSRELSQYSLDMELATNYRTHHKKFNYGYYTRLIQKIVIERGNDDEIKLLYPKGLKEVRNRQ